MGKCFVEFDLIQNPQGISFKHLQQILNSIQGPNDISEIYFDQVKSSWRVIFDNPNFLDGTEMQGLWSTKATPGTTIVVEIFSGVNIIDPPAQPTVPAAYTYKPISNWITPNINSPINLSGNPYNTTPPKIFSGTSISCCCGAQKTGGLHSSWCDVKN